jgi:hypothetical protein
VGEGRFGHAPVTDRHQFGNTRLVLFGQQVQWLKCALAWRPLGLVLPG